MGDHRNVALTGVCTCRVNRKEKGNVVKCV